MQKIFLSFLVALAAISCTSITTDSPVVGHLNSEIPQDKEVVKGVLPNGLTYYIRKNTKPEEKLELRLVVKAGSILENNQQLGLAHFMEHMNFNGSKNFNKNELVDYLQSIGVKFGAHLNAYTSFDETVYILPIPSDNEEKLEQGFQILEDWAFNASLTDEEIEKERGVVLEEYRLGLGAEKRMRNKYLPKLLYQSRYAERLPIGTKEVLENFTHDELRNFYNDWYRPDLMSVIAVGDIDPKILEKKIKEHFCKYNKEKSPKERKIYSSPNHQETFVSIHTDKEATKSTVQLYYKDELKTTVTNTVGDYKDEIITKLFNTMLNNRLDELRNAENPPFIYAGSWYSSLWDKSKKAFQCYALTSETGQLKAFENIVIENERVLRYGFLESELNRAKKSILNSIEKAYQERNKTSSKNYASEYIRNFLSNEPVPSIEWEFFAVKKLIDEITLVNCNSQIAQYIHQNNRVVIFTGPDKSDLTKIKEDDVLAILDNAKNLDIEPYREALMDEGLMKDITPNKGVIVKSETDSLHNITQLTLSSGATVTYKKTNFKNNQILFSAYSYGGTSLYSDEEYKRTAIANNALTEAGINGYDKNDLKKILSGKSVKVSPYISELSEGLKGYASPKDLETLFQLTYLYVNQLNYKPSAYKSYTQKMQAYYKNAISNPNTYFSIELGKFLNQNNPRYVGYPSDTVIKNTDFELAYRKYQERFSNSNDFHFYFIGNFDEETLKSYCEKYLAGLSSQPSTETYKDVSFPDVGGIKNLEVKKGTEPKSLVRIIFSGAADNYSQDDSYFLRSLGEVLTIKLVEQLREEESGVYGVSARGNISKLPKKEYRFSISFPCGPENVEKLTSKALAELDKIKKYGISEKDLNKIKETQLLEFKESQKKNNYWLNVMKNSDFYGNPIHDYLTKNQKIKKLTSDDIKKIANKYLEKNRVIATLKPE
ncbi:M16 family metallopeptidase [Wenyingzhuangia sp. IMCC45533]